MVGRLTRDELAARVVQLTTQNDVLIKRAERAEALQAAAAMNVEELKVKLLDTQIALARLEGYRDRVVSDDTANDQLIEVKRTESLYGNPVTTETWVPKRQVGEMHVASSIDNSCLEVVTNRYGHREETKKRHWVNF